MTPRVRNPSGKRSSVRLHATPTSSSFAEAGAWIDQKMHNNDFLEEPQSGHTTASVSSQNESKDTRTKATILFVIILIAYVTQSQLTQYVQGDLGYQQPYFIFYVAHSFYSLSFPLHLLYLTKRTGIPSSRYLFGLRFALGRHLGNSPIAPPTTLEHGKLFRLIIGLTLGVTCPAVLWYISVTFAPISDVTALFNTNAFWAYVLSVIVASSRRSRIQWEWKRLVAVSAACGGVFAVVYGGTQSDRSEARATTSSGVGSTILGDILALASSMCYALYQVMYTRYAVLDPETDPNQPPSPQPVDVAGAYQPLLTDDSDEGTSTPPQAAEQDDHVQPHAIKLPFGFFPNFLTSMIGVTTAFFLWIPIPTMHWLGVGQPFSFPLNFKTWAGVTLIAASGLVFNAGFMTLLGIWGPVVTSVGNLLTIVLVLASDSVFGNGLETTTMWSLLGCGMIIGAFSILAIDVLRN